MASAKKKKAKGAVTKRSAAVSKKKPKSSASKRSSVQKKQAQSVAPRHVIAKEKVKKVLITEKNLPPTTFAGLYRAFSLVVLAVTALFWSLLGATLHQGNADQIVNASLFENWNTFQNASFPAAHSMLVKWPLFYVVKLVGPSAFVFACITIFAVLATLGLFVYILHRIENRPIVFATITLALAAVLMLVPPVPYAGGILPVNMAMLATRNLEYILFIGCLAVLIRSRRFKDRDFWLGVLGLSLLAASDKLFLTLSITGAVLATAVYIIRARWALVRLASRWLVAGFIAIAATAAILWLVNASGFTHIVGKLESGPYGLIHTSKELGLGIIFAFLGLLTNFGANPAFDAAILRKIPELAAHRLLVPQGPSYVINLGIMVVGIYAAIRLLAASLISRQKKLDNPTKLSLLLIWSSLAATLVFVATNHYTVVDARYLTIILFTVFVSVATYARNKVITSEKLWMAAGAVITIGIMLSINSVVKTNRVDATALADVTNRTELILQSVKNHPVDVLVGDYWRVLPVKSANPDNVEVTPLQDCITPRDILSSKSWQPDLTKHSFAYILSFDKSLTNFPACTLDQIISHFGQPNQSTLIAGSLREPKEIILFYDHGAHVSAPKEKTETTFLPTSTVFPITLDQLPNKACSSSSTTVNIVAHEDDDLLFMNPDLLHDLTARKCVRTIYVTAGDAGGGKLYWQGREQGSEAAYSSLMGMDNIWIHRTVKLSDHEFITVANPRDNPRVTLIFIRLPDGNIKGQGFRSSQHESLESLEAGYITTMHTADEQSTYTSDQLTNVLGTLLQIYQPTEIRTQAPYNGSALYSDHSDHMAVGRYVRRSFERSPRQADTLIKYYFGYPVRGMEENVNGEELDKKTAAFLEYAQFDGSVCHSIEQCRLLASYGSYLRRQYTTQ